MQENEALMDVLFKKYYESIENGHSLDYDDVLENETLEISKKRQQHIEVILSIKYLV
ncbi:hypothetical protein KHA94_24380 [Bacillus sp. FJAT-49705]|uniref:Uncharacterized protein n=1 Tax=Cytobacillus citreus TaxID=2833586 RepID=A0ABS5NZH0_9BACI|nr:hypothetical protein [Cytobacillus citreus]MBS4193232.1 hypothetical protein [Cytobacillus citreus]